MVFREMRQFFNDTIWVEEVERLPFFRRMVYQTARVAYIVYKGFSDERLNQQAAALTYVFFLSLIPLIAVLFSLAKGFGFAGKVEPWVMEKLSPFIEQGILQDIIDGIKATPVGALGAIGFLVLIWTVLKTLFYLEQSFNQIWSLNNSRPLYRALAYYLSVIFIVPLLIAASTTLMAAFKAEEGKEGMLAWIGKVPGASALLDFMENLLPFGFTFVAFTLLYAFMTNTHVRLVPAMIGAFVASLFCSALQWLYLETNILISKNALYGTFAFLPILLVFLFLTWLLILFGCRIAFAIQNTGAFRKDRIARTVGLKYRAAAGLLVLQEVARAFQQGDKMPKPKKIAQETDLPLAMVQETLGRLETAGILLRVEREGVGGTGMPAMVPARTLEMIPVNEVIAALEGGESMVSLPKGAMSGPVRNVLDRVAIARTASLEGLTVCDLLDEQGEMGNGQEPAAPDFLGLEDGQEEGGRSGPETSPPSATPG